MTSSGKVTFRVDESAQIGFGHMSRCRALADALLLAGAQVSFCCRSVRGVTRAALERGGVQVVLLPDDEAFFQMDWRDHVVVVDGYQFDAAFWQRLRAARPRRTVCIDDLRDVQYVADIVICYNEGISAHQFRLREGSRLYLGGRYLLLRPEIRSAARLMDRPVPRQAVMLAVGGTRQEQWVVDMLQRMALVDPRTPVWVLSGRRLPASKVVRRSGQCRSKVRFFSGLDAGHMMGLYRRARYLVAPASTLMLEAFAAGCPLISGWVADNQRNSLDFYDRRGLIVNVGDLRHVTSGRLKQACGRVSRQGGRMIQRQRRYVESAQTGVGEVVEAVLA